MGLLNIVSAKRAPMTFTDLLRASSLPKATLHRILGTLVREGLLRHDPYNRSFQLGFRLLELAHEVWSDFDLRLAAQDALVRLRDKLDESVQLSVLNGQQVVVVASEQAGRDLAPVSSVGVRLPVHATAAGKAIAANLDPLRLRHLLEHLDFHAFTTNTLRDAADLQGDLALARARGYAMDEGEFDVTSVSVAAPIFDYEGRPIGALSVTGPASRLAGARAHSLSAALIATARGISHAAAGDATTIAMSGRPAPAAPQVDVRCINETRALLGEGPMWSPRDNALYWVDILTPSVHTHRASGVNTEIKLGTMASVVIPKATGGLLVATPGGLMTLDPDTKRMSLLSHPEADRPGNRYNDGKCDRRGRLWVASMDMGTAANRGSLFRVDADGSWKRMDTGFTVPNGLGWSPDDRKMYFTDTYRRTIYQYDFDLLSGTIANRRELIVFGADDGRPDGLTVDDAGCLWVALWDAWHIARFSPDGREMHRIRMPVPRPTSCCFGGASLETLYVTSASVRLSEEALANAPLSGSLFALEIPDVRGLPEATFAG
ncbi:SMP-30/gluconolactonase/LRE family protein [Roseateles noduli]|uniref:SMP-30/gluconolactonase/LRE family protein n=1 Tax=Roseateles noduli TaxID=2052484 RepID=UPI003D659432